MISGKEASSPERSSALLSPNAVMALRNRRLEIMRSILSHCRQSFSPYCRPGAPGARCHQHPQPYGTLSPTKQQAVIGSVSMTKNAERAKRFKCIDTAIKSIYNEVAWRDRRGRHEYEIHPVPVADRGLTSPSAGGPVMNTVQYDAGTE